MQELTGLTLAELKIELSPRISGADLVELLSTKFSRPKVFVVDVREHQEYPFVVAFVLFIFDTVTLLYPVVTLNQAHFNLISYSIVVDEIFQLNHAAVYRLL